jgi:hypothetical protein
MNSMKKMAHIHPLDIPPFQGRIISDYDTPALVESLRDCDTLIENVHILEDSRNKVGVVVLSDGSGETLKLVIKEFRVQGVDKLKSVFTPSKALKAWRGSLALVERGLLTPFPVAYLEWKNLFLKKCYFFSEYVPDSEEVRRLFRELPKDDLVPLMQDLAVYLSRCVRSGILHRDLSDGNVLVSKNSSGQSRFFLLDTNRIRCKKRIGSFQGIKSLIRLGIPPEFQRFFLAQYMHGSRGQRVFWYWYKMNKAIFSTYINLKQTLKLKRLAQILKLQ